MKFKKLPKSLFGELLELLYSTEIPFTLEWMWDGGMDWSFSQGTFSGMEGHTMEIENAMIEASDTLSNGNPVMRLDNIECVGGLIIAEYLQKFDGKNSSGEYNDLGKFLIVHGYMKEVSEV